MSPRKARLIGYIILFASFPFFGLAGGMTSVGGGILSMLFLIIGGLMAMEVVKTWLTTSPLMEEKYRRRVQKVCEINDKHCVPIK